MTQATEQTNHQDAWREHMLQRAMTIINNGPHDMGDLISIFEDADESVLASCWVACVVDSISAYGIPHNGAMPSIGSLAKALNVVNDRLCKKHLIKDEEHGTDARED